MTNASGLEPDDTRTWVPPGMSVPVERRDAWELAKHGLIAGLLAGLVLGLVEIVASTLLLGDPWQPFDFAAAILVGPEALAPAFPVGASVMLGVVIHVLLSIVFGVMFVAVLSLAFQLSARPWVLLFYGVWFGMTVWEVGFLALLPVIAPSLKGRLDLWTQVWNGIVAYCLVYGPILATYVIWRRPGTLDRWWLAETGS